MLTLDLGARFRNKTFILAMVGAIVLLVQQMGFDFIPSNYAEVVNTILTILTMLGIVVDTSTTGVSDAVPTTVTATTIEPVEADEADANTVSLQAENAELKAKLEQVQSLITPVAVVNVPVI